MYINRFKNGLSRALGNGLGDRFKNGLSVMAVALAGVVTSGCSLVNEDPVACPAQLRVRFTYDYNIKFADAFANEVASVNVWAFDESGKLVWSGSETGDRLAEKDFYIETPLMEGRYDFVSWCGLKDHTSFDLATYTPSSKEELEVTLKTVTENGDQVCSANLPGLFHGMVEGVSYEIDPFNPTFKNVVIPLVKDTKAIRVMLQHLDGSAIENRDFSVRITDRNGVYAWNNALLQSPMIYYKPWNMKYGETTAPGDSETKATITTVASLLFELSTGRLMVDSDAMLTVHRNWDNKDIIRIPLVDYLLLVKGHYEDRNGREIGDQEYLDRQDDYSMVFFIDPNSNWYVAGGIYINNWAVVPPQENPL